MNKKTVLSMCLKLCLHRFPLQRTCAAPLSACRHASTYLARGNQDELSMDTPHKMSITPSKNVPQAETFLRKLVSRKLCLPSKRTSFVPKCTKPTAEIFLPECPCNLERIYQPLPLNSVAMGHATKR
jgi:hypothetical protein